MRRWLAKFRWGAAAIVALALVAVGVGGYIVYTRVLNDSSDDAPVATTVETPEQWFGDRLPSACGSLEQFRNSAVFAYTVVYTARLSGSPWPTAQATAMRQLRRMQVASEELMADATPQGKAKITSMIEYQNQLRSAVEAAPSPAVYFKLNASFATPEQREVNNQILALADKCRS